MRFMSDAAQTYPPVEELRLPKVLAALADPARLAAVRALATNGESACTALQMEAGLRISRSTFSHHQRILREAGIIRAEVRGAQRILSLRRDDLDICFPGLLEAVVSADAAHVTG
jgi:DNA-binding transcriptional ArsR family regulator